jgi:hypothetical protein
MAQQGHWVPAEIEDVELTYSFEPHKVKKLKGSPWLYCSYCGLLYLRNPITKWCIKMGCNNSYHKQFKFMLNKLTKRGY